MTTKGIVAGGCCTPPKFHRPIVGSNGQIAPGGCIPPFPLPGGKRPGRKVSVSCNDPGLSAQTSKNGRTVVLKGETTNNGIKASVLTLKVDGKTINVPLSSGMTAWEVRSAVAKRLPKGYSLQMPKMLGRPNTRYASFEIVKDGKGFPRPDPRPIPLDSFQKAR